MLCENIAATSFVHLLSKYVLTVAFFSAVTLHTRNWHDVEV